MEKFYVLLSYTSDKFTYELGCLTAEGWEIKHIYEDGAEYDEYFYRALMHRKRDPRSTFEHGDETSIQTPSYLTLPEGAWIECIETSETGRTVTITLNGMTKPTTPKEPTTPEELPKWKGVLDIRDGKASDPDVLELLRNGWTLATDGSKPIRTNWTLVSKESTVPEYVLSALEVIRKRGAVNMLRRNDVLIALWDVNSHVYYWLKSNPNRYMEALNEMDKRVNKKHDGS